MANSFKSVASIKNYLSGAKTFLSQAGGDATPFQSPYLQNMLRGVARISLHVPQQAPPIPLPMFKAMCDLLQAIGGEASIARTALLIGYATLLRQSNLLPSLSPASPMHTIIREDVLDEGTVLWVTINSSKTITSRQARVSIPVPFTGSRYCPVTAWRHYTNALPLPPSAPAFMLEQSKPLTAYRLNSYMRATLAALNFPLAQKTTVHSLRRSGAQECAR